MPSVRGAVEQKSAAARREFEPEERTARREVLENAFANQLRAAATAFQALAPDVGQEEFESCARTSCCENFHAYRTYTGTPSPPFDAAYRSG